MLEEEVLFNKLVLCSLQNSLHSKNIKSVILKQKDQMYSSTYEAKDPMQSLSVNILASGSENWFYWLSDMKFVSLFESLAEWITIRPELGKPWVFSKLFGIECKHV